MNKVELLNKIEKDFNKLLSKPAKRNKTIQTENKQNSTAKQPVKKTSKKTYQNYNQKFEKFKQNNKKAVK